MKLSCRLAMLSAFLLVCTCTYIVTAQTTAPVGSDPGGGCNLIGPTTDGLIAGVNKTGVIPNVEATSGVFRLQVGGQSVTPWTLWSETEMRQHGMWCQVNSASNAGMGSDIGDMFYPTGNGPDGFTVVPTSGTNNVPYQQFKCTNQIGVVVDAADTTNFQGFLKCSTTIPNLNTNTHYSVIYNQSVIKSYDAQGLIVDSTMTLSVLSSRDADIALSFNVSFGPPSRINCTRGSSELLNERDDPRLTREVIRSRYISTTEPDMTRVTVRLDTQPRVGATYICTVYVESRGQDFLEFGTGIEIVPVKSISTTVTVTVAGTPTAVTVTRTAATNVSVSWTAPSTPPTLGGYEVFYQTAAGSNGSSTTTTTGLTLTGLMLGQTYSIFVVAFGTEGAPVLPSAHSNTEMITLTIPQLIGVTLTPTTSSVMVSWIAPQFITPDSYNVSITCLRFCDSVTTISGVQPVTNGGATSHNITALDPDNFCNVIVTAVFGSTSSESAEVFITTLTEAPTGAPGGLTSTSVESRSLTVQWGTVPCPDQRGLITGYRLRYSNGTSIVDTTGEGSRQHELTGLTPFTNYSVQVAAVNANGTGPYSTALTVETLQDIPGPVSGLSATPGVVQLTISWTAPSEPNGVITMYQVTHNSTGVLNYTNTSATQLTLRDLPPNTTVEYSVRAYTIIGPGEAVSNIESTKDIPSISISSVDAVSSTAVRVTWTRLNEPVVDHYTVHYSRVNGSNGRRRRQVDSGTVTFPGSASSGVVSGLQEGQQYQFSVSVSLLIGGERFNSTPGPSMAGMAVPLMSTTPLPPSTATPQTGATSSSTPTLTAPAPLSIVPIAGAIVGVLIVVIIAIIIVIVIVVVLKRQGKDKKAYAVHYVKDGPKVDSMEAHYEPVTSGEASEPEYAAVATKPSFGLFPDDATVLEGTKIEFPVKVAGTPDPQLAWYHESTRLDNDYAHEISTDGTLTIVTTEMKHAGNYRLVASNSAGTTEREFTLKLTSDTPEEQSGNAVSHPVRMAELGQYVARNHANTNKGFTTLYNSLDSCEAEHPVTVAVNATNKPLNRFNNITVYDDNHIVLQPITGRPDCQRDYINAAYIHGYDKEREFIACQGPINKTVVDHWRMIWQERAHVIVMVTNVKEDKKIKCQQYWPDHDTKDFGPFRITLTDQEIFANYTIRLLQIELLGSDEFPRMLTHYHFTSWPDHGVPEYGTPILAFHRRIKKEYKPSHGPMVVHCSAGVGRTGTFIAIDAILKQVEREEIVDVSQVITKMRHQRMKMVQTAEQYRFIHDVILESVTCGDTQINSGDLRPAIAKLKNRDPTTGKTLFQAQFEVLNQVTPDPQGTKCEAALQNRAKNRSMDYLPADKHRVPLKKSHPDYIQASFVNSYKHRRAFIVTQNPMENTTEDFWKMIIERDCKAIVMLNPLQENGQEVCYQYWPESKMERHGEYSVEVVKSTKQGGYVERIISATDKAGKPHQVTQFQIQNWNSQGKCSYPQTIITVVEEVNKVQRRTDNKPIVVHCSDTVSRSGLFCAIATTIDRCKTESVVDVFQVVKAQRIQKPGLVLTVEQYQFVFEAVLTFLESFETYSNFK